MFRSVKGRLLLLSVLGFAGALYAARCFGMDIATSGAGSTAVQATFQPMDLVMIALLGSGGLVLLMRPRHRRTAEGPHADDRS